jgi:DNA-binding response OmpR family regulator
LHVLIAEDDVDTLRLLEALVERLGHEVFTAADGAEAWSLLEGFYIPLVISDWLMPGMSGPELCSCIRRRRDAKYTYVILLTAVEGRERYLEAMESGVDDFLNKPPDFDQLTARIRVAERILGLERQVKDLEMLLPICTYCKQIRDEGSGWVPIERYLSERTETRLSHGICPDCYELRVKPQLDAL